ncbi:MAG: hypothetical protein MH204_04565, partial [Fimbriimonadaceae bacterium]|nr:hypothetical protein [Fimbriimonadaceae bacterium]
RTLRPWQPALEGHLTDLAARLDLPCAAAAPALHDRRDHFPVYDAVVCAHTLCTADEVIGRKPQRAPGQPPIEPRPQRGLNGERFLRSAAGFAAIHADRPDLMEGSRLIAERSDPDVLPGRTRLPDPLPEPDKALIQITEAGARERWGTITPAIRRRLDFELSRIIPREFSSHFLIAWDLCRWAADRQILFSGRGSVVDSAVAYCLGFSRIDALAHDLHFDRFLPEDGSKRPDIDIDFEAAKRDEARSYLVEKYGRENVAGVAAFGAYCSRGIIREVGRMLELPDDLIGVLSKQIHGSVSPDRLEEHMQKRPELARHLDKKLRLEWVFRLAREMMDLPRNIRAHSSGVVISARPVWETVPVQLSGVSDFEEEGGLRIIQWDKRSSKHWFDKFDIL